MPNHRVSWHAHTYTHACMCAYMDTRYGHIYLSGTCERKSALRRARDRDISTDRGLGRLIPCNGNEMNATEHEGRHETKFPAEGRRINRTLLLDNAAKSYCENDDTFHGIKTRITSARSVVTVKKIYARRHFRIACIEHVLEY